MKVEVKNNQLIITIDMQKPELSNSGKSYVVATTKGCVQTDVKVEGKPLTLGLNAFISK